MRLFFYIAYIGAAQEECSTPGDLENGSVSRSANSADFTCNPGYCFDGERTRTLTARCQEGAWAGSVGRCVPCDKCDLPSVNADMEIEWIGDTFDAKVTCVDGVIKPGSEDRQMTMSCIQGGRWNRDIPVCSRPSVINCEDDHMEAVIDKNMLRANGWDGDSSNIFLGNSAIMDMNSLDPECFAVEDDQGNYRMRIAAPFMGKCETASTIENQDYIFKNKITWRMETSFSVKEAHLLDFECVYRGVFMAGLPNKVKLAINTKQYEDNGRQFTVSMSVYDRANFTGLVDNIPILHRGKRYFVDLHLHDGHMGTPFLKNCYGSNNYVSEQELKEKYRMVTKSSSIRSMIVNGCPAPRTLVNLEESPNHQQTRFSFMFPKIGRGIADLQFVYLHCEIEMKEKGFEPVCDDNLYSRALKSNQKVLMNVPGKGHGFLKGGNVGARNLGVGGNPKLDRILDQQCKLAWMANTAKCQGRAGRERRSSSKQMTVGFGPLVVPEDEALSNEHPSVDQLRNVLDGSDVFVTEEIEIPAEIEREITQETEKIADVLVEELDDLEKIEIIRAERKERKIKIITCMAGGCILLFAISVFISSRVSCSCFKKEKKSVPESKLSSQAFASQIHKQLANPSNI